MSIRRGHVRAVDHFTTVSNAWVRDSNLTLRARGLLVYLLSHREGWRLSERQLIDTMQEGRDAIRGALRELEVAGYLQRDQVHGEGGQFAGVDYVTTDPPSPDFPPPGEQHTEASPSPENPSPGEQHPKKTGSSEDELLSAADASDTAAPAKGSKGSRIEGHLDADGVYPLTDRMKAWGRRNAVAVDDPVRETAKFVDYWCAQSGQRATMSSWERAWHTWMNNAQERATRFAPRQVRPEPGKVQR